MKLKPVTKLDKKNTATSKSLKIVTTLSWSVKRTFPLAVAFCLTKTKNKAKKSLTKNVLPPQPQNKPLKRSPRLRLKHLS